MSFENKFIEDIGKLKSDVNNLSTSVSRLCDIVDRSSTTLSKVSTQIDSSLERGIKIESIIENISVDILEISHIQKQHSIDIAVHSKKIDELEDVSRLFKNSKLFTKAIVWFVTAVISITIGIFGIDAALDANTKRELEEKNLELNRMKLEAEIEQEKKKDEYTREKWEKYFMRDSAIAERRVVENRDNKQ